MTFILRAYIITLVLGCSQVSASTDLCERAARWAAEQKNIPASVLLALSLTETGRAQDGSFSAWPWTLNIEGKGRYFQTRAAALAAAEQAIARGHRSTDLGCFQINYRWHGAAFTSVSAMLDPQQNALYAADYLLKLKAEFGQWYPAIGAYHSRNSQYSERYMERFGEIWAGLEPEAAVPVAQPQATTHAIASLFPLPVGGQ